MTTTPTAAPVTLVYDQLVRLPSWLRLQSASVFTLAGYAAKNGMDLGEMLERANKWGHSTLPSTIATLDILHTSAEKHARDDAAFAAAVTIEDGQTVEIDGACYVVAVQPGNSRTGPRDANPIAFRPVA